MLYFSVMLLAVFATRCDFSSISMTSFCSTTGHKPERVCKAKQTSAPGQLTTPSTSCRCFIVIWCNATIKIVLTAPSNLLSLVFPSTFEQIIPSGNSTAPIFFCAKNQQLQTTTHSTTSSVAACGRRSPAAPSYDDDVMTSDLSQQHFNG